MFGHERGAFTGAVNRRQGKFELADGGTLFLDEVGDLSLDAQAKLLRALEAGTIERVGGEREITVDVRIVAATNRDLESAVRDGAFREDLFYRLNVFPISVPPLRNRQGDVPALISHFAELAGARCGGKATTFTPAATKLLARHTWPGNVRELANIVERITIITGGGEATETHVRSVLASGASARIKPATGSLSEALEAHEAELITHAIQQADGNVADAARRLQTDRANLYRRMKRLGIGH
jgi:transcriptional regulator with GAF, ATPase, and Fis domain